MADAKRRRQPRDSSKSAIHEESYREAAERERSKARKRGGSQIREIDTENKPQLSGIDQPYTILVLLLLAVGLIALFSAGYADAYYNIKGGNGAHYIQKQGVFAVIGVIAMFAISKINYHHLHYLAIPGNIIVMIILSSRKWFRPIWVEHNGAVRWINLGFTEIQPSEFIKAAIIVLFASLITIYGPKKMRTFKYGVLPFMGILAVYAGLLFLQPHLSATIIIAAIGIAMMFYGGCRLWYAVPLIPIVGALFAVYLKIKPYAMNRIKAWWDPFIDPQNLGWHGSQSLMAIGSGGVWGLGLGQSRQKHLYLPEPANDFIFSVWCEEMGLVGAVLVIIAFAALIMRGYYIAANAGDRFGTLLAAGVTTQIAIQTLMNMGVVTGLLPVTGAPLPFFSYGGTSLLVMLAEVGLVLAVSRRMPVQRSG